MVTVASGTGARQIPWHADSPSSPEHWDLVCPHHADHRGGYCTPPVGCETLSLGNTTAWGRGTPAISWERNRRGIRRSNLAGCSCTAVMLPFPVEPASLPPAALPPTFFPLVLVTRSLPLLAKAFLAGTESRYVPSDVSFLSTCPFGKSMCPADNGLEWATKPNSFQPMPMTLAGYCWYCSGPWPCLEGSFPSNTRASLGLLFIQPNAQNDSDLTTRGHNVMAPGVFNNTSFMFIVPLRSTFTALDATSAASPAHS